MINKDDGSKDTKALALLLPGYNCGACGEKRCDDFAEKLRLSSKELSECTHMRREQFIENRVKAEALLAQALIKPPDKVIAEGNKSNGLTGLIGLIDGYAADIELRPLPGEPSCREMLFPFSRPELKAGDIIKYRPLGCPITHFASVLEEAGGLLTVHVTGPRNRLGESGFEIKEIGICMVGGFEGTYTGKPPNVGQTVRFVPHHCMMGKVHSGVVVQCIGDRIIIEGIDLKVWAPPVRNEVQL